MIFNGIYDTEIERLLNMRSRYRLAVTKEYDILDNRIFNIGEELSVGIGRISKLYGQNSSAFQMTVAAVLDDLIREHVFTDVKFGSIVILRNPGILFEPGLHIDVVGVLRRISKNTLTVLLWPGEMDGTALYFLDNSSKFIIKQTDINYTII